MLPRPGNKRGVPVGPDGRDCRLVIMVPPPARSLDKNRGPQGQACRAAIPALWPTKRSGAWRHASFLEAPAQVPGQEPLGRSVELDPVLRLGEAVPLVR